MESIEGIWNELNKTHGLFSNKAGNYGKYRPSYPKEAVRFIFSIIGKGKLKIADIGSGTGKLSKLLLSPSTEVFAVEPNADMRAAAEAELGGNDNYHSVAGTGESTGLGTDSFDVITVAEAYHWFDNEQSRLEFRRILKNGGYVFLIWNQFIGSAYDAELGEINSRFCPAYKNKSERVPRENRAESLFGKNNYEYAEFDNTISEPRAAFIGGSLSASCAPKPGDGTYENYVAALGKLFSKYEKDGLIELKIKTVCYYGKL